GMLRLLDKNIEARKIQNVQIVLGTPTDPKLPEGKLDLVLMVDVYHEFSEPISMMSHVRKSLKSDGRVVLVEFRKEDPNVPIQPLHKMSVDQVRAELEPMGFKFQKSLEFLPWQHIIIFTSDARCRIVHRTCSGITIPSAEQCYCERRHSMGSIRAARSAGT